VRRGGGGVRRLELDSPSAVLSVRRQPRWRLSQTASRGSSGAGDPPATRQQRSTFSTEIAAAEEDQEVEERLELCRPGCTVESTKRPRLGYPYSWRVDLPSAASSTASGGGLSLLDRRRTRKYTFAVASAAERDEWLARLRACLPSDGGGGEPGAAEEPPGQESQVDNLLDFAEFRHLLESDEELRAQLPGDWRARCRQICKLRRAFLSADLDGDQVRACGSACVRHAQVNEALPLTEPIWQTITRAELEVVLLSSSASAATPAAEMDALWRFLDPEGRGEVDWYGMLRGLELAVGRGGSSTVESQRPHEIEEGGRLAARLLVSALERPNCWPLLSLLVDVPIDREIERALLAEMSTVERFSIRVIRQVGGVHCARVSGPYMQRKERREWKRRPEKALNCGHGSLRQCLCLS
jgi:hypothetical protein